MENKHHDAIYKGIKQIKDNIQDMRNILNPSSPGNKQKRKNDNHNNQNSNENYLLKSKGSKYTHSTRSTEPASKYQADKYHNIDSKHHCRHNYNNYNDPLNRKNEQGFPKSNRVSLYANAIPYSESRSGTKDDYKSNLRHKHHRDDIDACDFKTKNVQLRIANLIIATIILINIAITMITTIIVKNIILIHLAPHHFQI
mgnify:CR=1 FL=1